MFAGLVLGISLLTSDPSGLLHRAYQALQNRQYDTAVSAFREAIRAGDVPLSVRKDLAYTLLKIGETGAARDEFAFVVRADPADTNSALEYGFLCHETKQTAEARRTFERLMREAGDPARATAAQAFEAIDAPLRAGIARWQAALALTPNNDSAHEEVARLAEVRGDLAQARVHYQAAVTLRPDRSSLALDLGRVLLAAGDTEAAHQVLRRVVAQSEPRAAELARELLPPGVAPADGPAPVSAATASASAKQLGLVSLQKSYLLDAQRYLLQAHAEDPGDAEVMLNLGRVYNQLGQDSAALPWFDRARRSADEPTRREAGQAWRNLGAGTRRVTLTAWAFPMYSSRWNSAFLYGQAKAEFRLGRSRWRPYLSARLMGDLRTSDSAAPVLPGAIVGPVQLSERSVIAAAGLSAPLGRGLSFWAEAGEAIRYREGGMVPDYRGGLFFQRGWGTHLTAQEGGWFTELDVDALYVSRYDDDILLVAQNRIGYTAPPVAQLGGLQWQVLLHTNFNVDSKREYWANFVDVGPGYRFRWNWMPRSLYFGAQALFGSYFHLEGNPYGPRYRDLRIGVWYAFTR